MPSSRAQRDAARDTVSALRQLWNEWDPIGVASDALDDEYNSYLGPTLKLLESGASEEALTEYLAYLVRDYIGLGEEGVAYSNPLAFARSLRAWFQSRKEVGHEP